MSLGEIGHVLLDADAPHRHLILPDGERRRSGNRIIVEPDRQARIGEAAGRPYIRFGGRDAGTHGGSAGSTGDRFA
jgi:hypothetical protein